MKKLTTVEEAIADAKQIVLLGGPGATREACQLLRDQMDAREAEISALQAAWIGIAWPPGAAKDIGQ